jgi:hypothetical protein
LAFENERRIEDEEEEEEVIYFLFISSHWSAKRLLTSCQPSFGIEDKQHKKKKKNLPIFNLKNMSRLKNDINKLGRAVETLGVIQHFSRKKIKEMKYLDIFEKFLQSRPIDQ